MYTKVKSCQLNLVKRLRIGKFLWIRHDTFFIVLKNHMKRKLAIIKTLKLKTFHLA